MVKSEMKVRLEVAIQQMRRVLEADGLPFDRTDFLKAMHLVEDFEEACLRGVEGHEAAARIRELEAKPAAERRGPGEATLRSQVLALADLKDGWYDGEGTAYDADQLKAVADVLDRLIGLANANAYPIPCGRISVEWHDGHRSDSLEIDPYTTAMRLHLYDLESGEVVVGEIAPESLLRSSRPGEAWIPVAERLPTTGGEEVYVICAKGRTVAPAVYSDADGEPRWCDVSGYGLPIVTPTHWMPLPPPPGRGEAADA